MDFYSSILHIHKTHTDIIQVQFLKLSYKASTFEDTWLACQKKNQTMEVLLRRWAASVYSFLLYYNLP